MLMLEEVVALGADTESGRHCGIGGLVSWIGC